MPAKRKGFPKRLLGRECEVCTSTLALEHDHWDNNNQNNTVSNHRTLCRACNQVKAHFHKTASGKDKTENQTFLDRASEEREKQGTLGFRESRNVYNLKRQEELDRAAGRQVTRRQHDELGSQIEHAFRSWFNIE